MNTKKYLLLGIIAIVSFAYSCSSNSSAATNLLIGKWATADSLKIEFKENGKAVFEGVEISYSSSKDSITLDKDNIKLSYHYTIDNDKLSVNGADLDAPLKFVRISNGILSNKKNEESKKAGILGNASGASGNSESKGSQDAKTIYDTWISAQETIELRADGNCIYLGQAYKFKYDGTQILLTTPDGEFKIGCKLNGDQLSLTTSQGTSVYQRKGTTSTTKTSTSGMGQELVGKWCYMSNSKNISFNDCFTINANGTYSTEVDNSMSSDYGDVARSGGDHGTWTFDGNTIHVQSSANGAQHFPIQKTYNKNGDPCIVIGGKTYFSYYKHARW